MQTLDVISVNLWQMVAALGNLILLFVVVKKFLYKPVKKMLAARENAINQDYDTARKAKDEALKDKKEYEDRLLCAEKEADSVIKSAVSVAKAREKEIVADAHEKADGIVRQAKEEAALELKKAEEAVKKEIAEVSSALAGKLLEREIGDSDHQHFIDSFIESIGDGDDRN